MNWFAATLAPILLVLLFYALLGIVLRVIFHPTWSLGPQFRPLSFRPVLRLPDFDRPATRRWVLGLVFACAGMALTLPLPDWVRFLIAQIALLAAVLVAVDVNLRRHLAEMERARLLMALRSPIPDIARDALSAARRLGLLQDGTLAHQDWHGVHWAGADLSKADLTGADLQGADLRQAGLTHTRLAGANLSHADLTAANLDDADLSGATLASARAKSASFRRARLVDADCTGARLQACDFALADLRGSDLRGVNLKQAELSGAALAHVRVDPQTRFPKSVAAHFPINQVPMIDGRIDGNAAAPASAPPTPKEPEQSAQHLR